MAGAPREASTGPPPGASRPRATRRARTRRRICSSSASVTARSREQARGTLSLQGSIRRRLSVEEGRDRAQFGPQRSHPHLEQALHHPAAVCRADLRGAQRAEAYSRERDRGHDRSQVRRVRADQDLSRPQRRQEGRAGEDHDGIEGEGLKAANMGKPKRERALADDEAKAVAKNLRISPQKLNLLAQRIRSKTGDAALPDLG